MIIITICPIFIYFVFVTELDHVKFVIDDARCYTKKNKDKNIELETVQTN